jgi:hypothetical protein
MSTEYENVLENVDLGDDALDAEDSLEVDGGEGHMNAPEKQGEAEADQQVAETDDDSQEDTQDSDETASTTPPAKDAGKRKSDQVPLAKFMGKVHENRDLKLRLAQYEAEKAIPAPQVQATPSKSPMDTFIEKEGLDAVPTAGVLQAQAKWDREQSQSQASAATDTVANLAVNRAAVAMTDEVMGEGLGFGTLLSVGRQFLTKGDIVDIKDAGNDAGKLMYKRLLERTIQSGTPQGKLVRAAYRQVQQERASSTTQDNPTGKGKPKPVQQREAPTREEVIDRDYHDDEMEDYLT